MQTKAKKSSLSQWQRERQEEVELIRAVLFSVLNDASATPAERLRAVELLREEK